MVEKSSIKGAFNSLLLVDRAILNPNKNSPILGNMDANSGGSKGALGTPTSVQLLSFSCSFWLRFCQMIGWHTLLFGNPESTTGEKRTGNLVFIPWFEINLCITDTSAVNDCTSATSAWMWTWRYVWSDVTIQVEFHCKLPSLVPFQHWHICQVVKDPALGDLSVNSFIHLETEQGECVIERSQSGGSFVLQMTSF